MKQEDTKPKVAFLGLGVMGFPMAGHLAQSGYAVSVYNRTQSRAEKWCDLYGGKWEATPCKAVKNSAIVFACVGNDEDIRSITLGSEQAFAGMAEGSLFVDHTTTSASVARELSEYASTLHINFVDAPISGGQKGAEEGSLTIMCGGSHANFGRAFDVMSCYAKTCRLLGDVGSGQLTKMVNQICIAGLLQGLSEALNFAERAGLNGKDVVDVIRHGAAQSWQMDNRYETMLNGEYEHGFAVEWMRKDLDICLSQARELQVSLPITALIEQFYCDVELMGGARWDTSSLYERMKKLS